MTAANMTALIEVAPTRTRTARTRTAPPTVDIAGVAWPRHKVYALIAALIVGLLVAAVTGFGPAVAWWSGLTLLAVWWGERLRQMRRRTQRPG
ncbi:hypothetical protein AAFP35_21640 [Gordonia sp. CPCC 206044]|uniref:hypothetical protein n=1 Tax=Gordonia sp. CPCC 206044 TaxID=3140793 RepID=UPI003AF3E27E